MRFVLCVLALVSTGAANAAASAPAAYGYGPSRPWTEPLDLRPHLQAPRGPAAGQGAEGFAVQLGAFQDLPAAERIRQSAGGLGPSWIAELRRRGATLHRVRLGPFATRPDAEAALARAQAAGFRDAVLAQLR